jgi:hypothetical protein
LAQPEALLFQRTRELVLARKNPAP